MSTKIKVYEKGEDTLSPFNRRLWDFTYTVLLKFQCPLQFKIIGPDVRQQLDLHISFYVPRGRDDVIEYIIQEWQDEVRITDNSDENKDWFWSTLVDIYTFDGPGLYTDSAIIKELSSNMLLYLTAKSKNKDADIKDFTDIEHNTIN